MTVVACIKWLTPHDGDDRFGGISPADASALEWALRIGEARNEPVVAVTLGPTAADAALRDALACGAQRAIRIDTHDEVPSADTAAALAQAIDTMLDRPDARVSYVCCGDYSLDRGTGSVPAFLAAELEAGQALGLIEVTLEGSTPTALRRLDGGRRERLRIDAPSVLSVEGATAVLRRAPLAGALKASSASIDLVAGPIGSHLPTARRPFRPRARVLPPPTGAPLDRVKMLLNGAAATKSHGVPVELSPVEAADRIIDALRGWGYLD